MPTGKYLAIVAGAVVGKEVRFDAVFQPLVPERLQAFASGGYEASAIAKEFDEHVKRRQKRAFNTVQNPSPTTWAPVHRESVISCPHRALSRFVVTCTCRWRLGGARRSSRVWTC